MTMIGNTNTDPKKRTLPICIAGPQEPTPGKYTGECDEKGLHHFGVWLSGILYQKYVKETQGMILVVTEASMLFQASGLFVISLYLSARLSWRGTLNPTTLAARDDAGAPMLRIGFLYGRALMGSMRAAIQVHGLVWGP